MSAIEPHLDELRRDGFSAFRDILPPDLTARAHAEILRLCAEDLADRARTGNSQTEHRGAVGRSRVVPEFHLLVDAFGRSPALDQLIELILTHPVSAGALEKMVGKHVKVRGYNIRVMSGVPDPRPPYPGANSLEWHRDSPGEIGISLLLNDVPNGGNGGTGMVRGSHLYPYDPRWNTLFSPEWMVNRQTGGLRFFARRNLFSRLLARRVLPKNEQEASGKAGDFYYFFNDTWHGRFPNTHGGKGMIVLIGIFASEAPFPDKVTPPPEEVLKTMPPRLRSAVALTEPPNIDNQDSLLHWMARARRSERPFGLFWLARIERKLVNALTLFLIYRWPVIVGFCRDRLGLGRLKRFVGGLLGRRTPPKAVVSSQAADESKAKAA